MDKIFAEIFSKEPPYILEGDYFYFNPYYEEMSDDIREHYEKIVKKQSEGSSRISGRTWRTLWEERTFQREPPTDKVNWGTNIREFGKMYEAINNGVSKINEVFGKIAAESKPLMDISSCNSFGLIPFIVKMNPQVPCMATDMEAPVMRFMRTRVNRDLSEYNISLASFDNRDIPIKDNSLDYVTSTFGIGSVLYDNAPHTFFSVPVDREKPIKEVYRILKPGGCYVAIEHYHDWKFDLAKTREACKQRGNLFGLYTYNEIEEVQNKLKVYLMHNQFIAAGFEVEIGEKYPQPKPSCSIDLNPKSALSHLAHILKIREWTDEERELYKGFSGDIITIIRTPEKMKESEELDKEAEDYGIEFAEGDIFYVLRKPI